MSILMATTSENTKSQKFENLIGETDKELDKEVRERLIGARVGLLLKKPFFGSMATRLTLTNADTWCSTAATDGRKFYYNSRFVDMLDNKELEFLFGHEVLHCCYDHLGRKGDRDAKLWNVADDYAVNRDLIKHSVGRKITTVPCLYDSQYDGMPSEEIYDLLYENADKVSMDDLLDQMIDEHLDGDGEGEGGNGKPKPMSAQERKELRDEIKEAMMTAAQNAGGAGNVPDGVQRMIKELTEPKMNWRELLRQTLESSIKSDYSWMRPNRRNASYEAIIPGMAPGEEVDIVVAMDMSGSISHDTARDFLSEVQGIMDAFTSFKIHVFTFDTEVYNPQTYTSDNLDEITDYEIHGGGGTDFDCIFKYLVDDCIEPERLVIFTDMYPWNSWGDENYCETLFVAHGTTDIEAPYGMTAYYDKAE